MVYPLSQHPRSHPPHGNEPTLLRGPVFKPRRDNLSYRFGRLELCASAGGVASTREGKDCTAAAVLLQLVLWAPQSRCLITVISRPAWMIQWIAKLGGVPN